MNTRHINIKHSESELTGNTFTSGVVDITRGEGTGLKSVQRVSTNASDLSGQLQYDVLVDLRCIVRSRVL